MHRPLINTVSEAIEFLRRRRISIGPTRSKPFLLIASRDFTEKGRRGIYAQLSWVPTNNAKGVTTKYLARELGPIASRNHNRVTPMNGHFPPWGGAI